MISVFRDTNIYEIIYIGPNETRIALLVSVPYNETPIEIWDVLKRVDEWLNSKDRNGFIIAIKRLENPELNTLTISLG